MLRTLIVAVGGGIGAVARYLVGGLVYRVLPETFPWATFLINVSGCLAIGFLAVLADERLALGPAARLFLMVGILGGYTTFSSFGLETLNLAREGGYWAAAGNAIGQVVLGLASVWAGAALARSLA